MKNNGIAIAIVSIIVGLIMVVGVLVPIIDVGVDPYTTINNGNTAFSQLNELDTNEEFVLSRDGGTSIEWDANGKTVSTMNISTIVLTDAFSFIVNNSWQIDENIGTMVIRGTGATTNIPSAYDLSFEFDGSVATITYGETPTTVTLDYNWAYVLAPLGKGEYTNVYGNAQITNYNEIMIGSNSFWGRAGEITTLSGGVVTVSGGASVDGYESLIKIDNDTPVVFSLSDQSTSSPKSFIVPTEIKAYEEYDSGTWGVLISILPIFVVIGLIVATTKGRFIRD